MRSLLYTILLAIIFSGCYNAPPDFSDVPVITYEGIKSEVKFNDFSIAEEDTITISIGFKDGDGNLGTNPATGKDNYFLTMFKIENGVANVVANNGGQDNSGKFPVLGDGSGPVEGILNYGFRVIPSENNNLLKGDSLYFEVFIADGAEQASNVITTDVITLKAD